jgi:hypothetical protein
MEIFRRLYAPTTPFYTPNVAHANFSAETVPVNHKTQSFKFRRQLCYFVPDWDISALKRSFYSILHAERSARQNQRRNNPRKSQNAIFQISTKTVISFQMEIFRRLYALTTPFYTPNVAHANFSAETIPVNPKTQSFKFRRKLCHFVPHWDISAFIRSFHSILNAEISAHQFQRRQNPCKSQNAIFQISTKTLLFRSRWRYFGVYTLVPLHSTRRT